MKNLREQNPFVLALAIIGVCALLYGAWSIYHRHAVEEEQRAILSAPAQGAFGRLNQPSKKPPPQ
jgi:hypothetical protein